jgi:hypothetical protein
MVGAAVLEPGSLMTEEPSPDLDGSSPVIEIMFYLLQATRCWWCYQYCFLLNWILITTPGHFSYEGMERINFLSLMNGFYLGSFVML